MEIFRARLWAWETPVDAISSGRPLSGTNILLCASLLAIGGPSWAHADSTPSQVKSSQVHRLPSSPAGFRSTFDRLPYGCLLFLCRLDWIRQRKFLLFMVRGFVAVSALRSFLSAPSDTLHARSRFDSQRNCMFRPPESGPFLDEHGGSPRCHRAHCTGCHGAAIGTGSAKRMADAQPSSQLQFGQ